MSTGRHFSADSYLTLKASFRRLTKIVGGQESAASITRVDFQRIGRYGRPADVMHAPVDVVVDMEADAGTPAVTRIMADLQGYLLIAKPPVEGDSEWVKHLGALGKEVGEAMAKLSEAFSDDGIITAKESRDMNLRSEVRDAMEVLARIDQVLEILESEGAGDD